MFNISVKIQIMDVILKLRKNGQMINHYQNTPEKL